MTLRRVGLLAAVLLLGSPLWAQTPAAVFQQEMQHVRGLEQGHRWRDALEILMRLTHKYAFSGGDMDVYNHGDGRWEDEVGSEADKVLPQYLTAATRNQREANRQYDQERAATQTTMPRVSARHAWSLGDVALVNNTLKFGIAVENPDEDPHVGSSSDYFCLDVVDVSDGAKLNRYSYDGKVPKANRFELYSRTTDAAWSPDQHSLAFTFNGALCVQPPQGKARMLDNPAGGVGGGDSGPVWTSDGAGLFFTQQIYDEDANKWSPPVVFFVTLDGVARTVTHGNLLDVAPKTNDMLVRRDNDVALCSATGQTLHVWPHQTSGSFSPDGSLVALVYTKDNPDGFTLSVARRNGPAHALYKQKDVEVDSPVMWMNQGRLLFEVPGDPESKAADERTGGLVVLSVTGQRTILKAAGLLPWATSRRIATQSALLDLSN